MISKRRTYFVIFTVLSIFLAPVILGPVFVWSMIYFFDYSSPRSKSPFPEAHQRAVNSFVNSAGFGFYRLAKSERWNELSLIFEDTVYRKNTLHLIGLTPELGDRYFEEDAPRKKKLPEAKHRPLTKEEAEAIAKIHAGAPWVHLPAPPYEGYQGELEQIRVIAPIFAQQSCLECHEVKEGTLLGAFDYWLYDPEKISKADPKKVADTKPPATQE